jgi:hypothetical protein
MNPTELQEIKAKLEAMEACMESSAWRLSEYEQSADVTEYVYVRPHTGLIRQRRQT